MVQSTGTGIGRALRTARLRQGKTLEEASRDTRVRSEYLEALEREEFDRLRGDVYVRGFLRSYARYLGLSADKVISAYERLYRSSLPAPAPVEQAPGVGPTEAVILTGGNRRPSWLLAAVSTAVVLTTAAAIGLFSARNSVPPPATSPEPPPIAQGGRTVQVGVVANRPITVQVRIDGGEMATERLEEGEALSFEGQESVEIRVPNGAAIQLEVNGTELGRPGAPEVPFQDTFFPADFRDQSTSEPPPTDVEEEKSPSPSTPAP
jgi:transcriptional regulator with XRE-family HTH domain